MQATSKGRDLRTEKAKASEGLAKGSSNYDIIDMQGGEKPYYLHVEEEEDFPTNTTLSASELMSAAQEGLRAAPVTTATMYNTFGVFAAVWEGLVKLVAASSMEHRDE